MQGAAVEKDTAALFYIMGMTLNRKILKKTAPNLKNLFGCVFDYACVILPFAG